MRTGVIVAIAGVALAGVVIGFMAAASNRAHGPDSPRVRVSAALVVLSDNRLEIERFANEHGSLKGSARVVSVPAPSDSLGKVLVSADGALAAVDPRGAFVVFLEPELVSGSVQWRCSVVPATFAPGACRG